MKSKRLLPLAPLFLAVFGIGPAIGQTEPPLPYEDAEASQVPVEILGLNSFRGGGVPGMHSDVPRPPLTDIVDPTELLPRPELPQIPRYYITCYYYGCRPWFVNPYTGAPIAPWQLFQDIQFQNPDWQQCAAGRPLDALVNQIDPVLGEPLIQVDQTLIDGNDTEANNDWISEQAAEQQNFDAVGGLPAALRPTVRPIIHAPYYGLYCLRVRICVPIFLPDNHWRDDPILGRIFPRWRFWCRFPYRRLQPICWSRTWWHRWYPPTHPCNPTADWRICGWRPWCLPFVRWTRSGPDWVCHVQSVNRWRHWCLFGFRYYFPQITSNPILQNININDVQQLPTIAQLDATLVPPQTATPWLRPWPYPFYRYWPYRPYCTRWYWFRCLPWWRYRHFPPIVQFAVATPRPQFGAGFVPDPGIPDEDPNNPGTPLFAIDAPNLADGTTSNRGATFDSFFDIDVECRGRAFIVPDGDNNGDGRVDTLLDVPVGLQQLRGLPPNQDTQTVVAPPVGSPPEPAEAPPEKPAPKKPAGKK